MLALFRSNQSYLSLLLYVYALVLQLPFILKGEVAVAPKAVTIAGSWIYEGIYQYPWLVYTLPVLLVGTVGFLANILTDRFRMARTITQYPGLFVVLVWAAVPAFHGFHLHQLEQLFLAMSLFSVGSTYKNNASEVALFNTGLWLGLASLFQPSYLLLLPAYVVAIGTLRTLKIRSILQVVTGIAILYFLVGTYHYWNESWDEFLAGQLTGWQIGELVEAGSFSVYGLVLLGIYLLIVVVSSSRIRSLLNIQGNKNVSVLFWLLLFLPLVAFVGESVYVANAQAIILPLGILLGLWFVRLGGNQASVLHLFLWAGTLVLGILA